MQTVVKSLGSTAANGAIWTATQNALGFLADPFALAFQVFDISDAAKEAAPVQVYPVMAGDKQAVDLENHKLGTGRFVAVWDSSAVASQGKYRVRWFYKLLSADVEKSFDTEAEVIGTAYPFGPQYCSVYDLRAEGAASATYSDLYLQQRIAIASRDIERFTGRTFAPVFKTVEVNGKSTRILQLNEPICAIESVETSAIDGVETWLPLDSNNFRVYNRHLTQNLASPDDRENPKLEQYHTRAEKLWDTGYLWGHGQQNIRLAGIFGYTDPDGSMVGCTPWMIRHVCKLLVIRKYLATLTSSDSGSAQPAGPIIREKTREQEIEYAQPSTARQRSSDMSGDPEIDSILVNYIRPPQFGAA